MYRYAYTLVLIYARSRRYGGYMYRLSICIHMYMCWMAIVWDVARRHVEPWCKRISLPVLRRATFEFFSLKYLYCECIGLLLIWIHGRVRYARTLCTFCSESYLWPPCLDLSLSTLTRTGAQHFFRSISLFYVYIENTDIRNTRQHICQEDVSVICRLCAFFSS